jgi:lysozyme
MPWWTSRSTLGSAALACSTLLKKLNAGDTKGAAEEFLKWDKAGGKVLAGLTKRRKAERALFLS